MKLTQVMLANGKGGAENFFARLALELSGSNRLDQNLILRNTSPYMDQLALNSVIYPINPSSILRFLVKNKLQSILSSEQPDIVLTWMNRATGLVGDLYAKKSYQHVARLGGFYNLKYYKHCDHFIANTSSIADYLLKSGIQKERIHHISNFVEEIDGNILQKPSDGLLVVAVGRLHINKAFDTLIKSIAGTPNCYLWLIGDGPERGNLEQLINYLGLNDRVKLLGWQDRPQDFVATADVFVCPSRHEPLGNVILEAWYQRKPVLATKSHGALELIKDGENGILCEIDSPQDLSQKLKTLLDDAELRNSIALQGRSSYDLGFSKDIIINKYLELFFSVI